MSFVVPGLTHCSKHHFEPLDDYLRCAKCEQEKREKEQKERQYRETRLEQLVSFTDDEIKALKILVADKAEEIRKERIKKQIEKLQKELGD
jgi:hypothetical protein